MVSASLTGLTVAGEISAQVLLAGAVLLALSNALEMPTRQAVVPNLVPTEQLRALFLIRKPLQGTIMTRASVDALMAVRTQPVMLACMILDCGATCFGSSMALMPIYARDYFGAGPVAL